MNFLTASNLILSLLPIISNVIKQVEELNKTPGNGKAKLELALVLIREIYNAANPPESFDSIRAKVEGTIAALVTFYNTIGAFVKAVKAA